MSGGYADDEDHGLYMIYTGQGGNNPRTGRQTDSQEMSRGNAALVTSFKLKLPVRLIRGSNAGTPYSPSEGYSYDGLFLVKKYWQETRSGNTIYRFRLKQTLVEQ